VRAEGHFGLKNVAARGNFAQAYCFQSFAPPAFETAGEIGERQPGDDADVQGGCLAQEQPLEIPVHYADPFDVTGSQDYVMRFGGFDEGGQIGWIVREIGIHLDDQVVIQVCEGVLKTGEVGWAEPLFVLSVKNSDAAGISVGEFVSEISRAIGRVIVHHQHVNVTRLRAYRVYEVFEVLAFVVGRYNNDGLHVGSP
jgi:hypothetical protein